MTLEKGFELKGKISNTTSEYERYYKSNNVQRILYIKDTLYTISQNTIKAVNMNTMEIKGTISVKKYKINTRISIQKRKNSVYLSK